MNRKFTLLIGISFAIGLLVTLLLSLSLAAQTRAMGSVSYEVTDLGTLDSMGPMAINNNGEVAGTFEAPNGEIHAFRWQNGVLTDLGTIGGTGSEGRGINDAGTVAGCSLNTDDLLLIPVKWNGTTPVELDPEGCGDDINASGTVAGWIWTANPFGSAPNPAVWNGTQGTLLDVLPGDVFGDAFALNDSGQVVGTTREWGTPFTHKAVLWNSGNAIALPNLGGHSQANDINEAGKIVGWSGASSGGSYPVMWDNGVLIDLSPTAGSGSAVAINNEDDILIQGFFVSLLDNGILIDLNQAIDPNLGWLLEEVRDINDNGWIIGNGSLNGESHAFLLTPCLNCVPDPTPTPSPSPTPTLEKPWTVMFYLDGDNDLDATYPPILNRLEVGANNPNVNVVALWDNTPNLDTAYIEVQYDTDLNQSFPYDEGVNYWSQGELAMNDPATLSNFITWAVESYPAQHYALILDDHGSGLGGGLCDGSGTDACPALMDLADMQQALATAYTQTGEKMDVLYMAMCLMGMLEDGYQFRDYADYYVANETIQWAFSTPYTEYVQDIQADSTPAEVATLFASAYADIAYEAAYPYTISAVDLNQISSVVTATNALATALDANLETITSTLALIVQDVQRFDQDGNGSLTVADTYIDLYHFAALVEANINEPDIIAAAQQVQQAVLNYVIYENHGSDLDVNLSNSHGVSIFFPGMSSSFYDPANYDFAVGANWGGGSLAPAQGATTWAGILGSYFQLTQPGGPDDPTPPDPISKSIPLQFIFLPVITR